MGKIAILSDVHGNFPALQATLKVLEKEDPTLWICLGDIVGYGPHPSECIEEMMKRNIICVMGNHDAAVSGKIPLKHFRNPNRKLLELTQSLITEEQKEWLGSLPLTIQSGKGHWIAAHASPVQPAKWQYLESAHAIRPLFAKIEHTVCFVGHTHKASIVSDTIGLREFKTGHKYFINPGSVGQPRSHDRQAYSAVVDIENYEYKSIAVRSQSENVIRDLRRHGFSRKEAEHLMYVE